MHGYVVYYHGTPVPIPYPDNAASPSTNSAVNTRQPSSPAESGLKPEGRSFHHGRFVASLRKACMREANITIFETKAESPIVSTYSPDTVLGVNCITGGSPDYFFAPMTIAADGYASKFRNILHPHSSHKRSRFYGLELQDCALPYPNMGHVVLGDMPPILLYQIGTHETRILVDVPDNCPTAKIAAGGVNNHMSTVVVENLPESIRPSYRTALAQGKLRSMPNSFLPPALRA